MENSTEKQFTVLARGQVVTTGTMDEVIAFIRLAESILGRSGCDTSPYTIGAPTTMQCSGA